MAASSNVDNGWGSRKLWFSVFVALLLFGGALLTSKIVTIKEVYGELSWGLLGALSVFSGANVFSSWAAARKGKSIPAVEAEEPAEEEEPAKEPEKPSK